MSAPSPIPAQPLPGGESSRLQVPRLGGSPVGFWLLIVSLVLIVIISCTAIFWLLKTHDPTPAERARRRAKRDAEKASAEAVSTSEHSDVDPRTFKERIGRFFGRGGWTKANDDIEIQKTSPDKPDWRTEDDKEETDPYIPTTRSGYGVPSDQHHEYQRDSRMSSTSTVELSAPSSEHTPIISRGVDLPFEPPYRSESPQPDLSPPPSEAYSTYERPHQGERSFSVMSGDDTAPMRKFGNGTKFMEQI